jgi:hypothetical protein
MTWTGLMIIPYSCGKKGLNLLKRFILLGDLFISIIGSNPPQGEVPPHPHPSLPLQGGRDGWGRTIFILFYETLRYILKKFFAGDVNDVADGKFEFVHAECKWKLNFCLKGGK